MAADRKLLLRQMYVCQKWIHCETRVGGGGGGGGNGTLEAGTRRGASRTVRTATPGAGCRLTPEKSCGKTKPLWDFQILKSIIKQDRKGF